MSVNNRLGQISPTSAYQRITPDVQTTKVADAAVQPSTKVAAVNLFDRSSYQKAVDVADTAGQALRLPTLSDEEADHVQALFDKVPDSDKEKLNAASSTLGAAMFNQMLQAAPAQITTDEDGQITGINSTSRVVGGGGQVKLAASAATSTATAISTAAASSSATGSLGLAKPSPAVVTATQGAAQAYANATGTEGSDAVMATAYMGVIGLQGQMSDFAATMQQTLGQKKSLDSDYQELKDAIDNWPEGTETQVLPKVVAAEDGTVSVTQEAQTLTEAKASAEAAQSSSQNLGSDNQMQMIQMQYIQQQYSNAINGISNIMKVGYDMAKNTIGNIHY